MRIKLIFTKRTDSKRAKRNTNELHSFRFSSNQKNPTCEKSHLETGGELQWIPPNELRLYWEMLVLVLGTHGFSLTRVMKPFDPSA